MRRAFLLLIPLLISGCLFSELSREEYCEKAWRWDLECALNITLSEGEILKVNDLAKELRGKDCVESAWNVLKWVEENIEYDSQKALLPTPTIFTRGKEVVIQDPERTYQTPSETVKLKKGICGDYAILISALMANLDCKPYILRFEFEGEETGHLATAIFLEQYYILDQKLPPMDLGSYYNKWLGEGKRIKVGYIYDKGLLIGNITPTHMQKFDYKLSVSDLEFLESYLRAELKKRCREDTRIPSGYWEYSRLRITFQNYAELYTPVFSEKIAERVAEKVIEEFEKSKKDWKAFKVEISENSGALVVELELAR